MNDLSASSQKEWNSPIFNLSTLMTSHRGSRQRAGLIAMSAVLPPRTIWLISKGPPALEMQTPHGAPLINSPPVINGGDVREDVTPKEICWKWIGAGCWEGWWKSQQPRTENQGGKTCLSERVERASVKLAHTFCFYVEFIFIIFYVMTNRLPFSSFLHDLNTRNKLFLPVDN